MKLTHQTPDDLWVAKQETFSRCYGGTGVVLPSEPKKEDVGNATLQAQQRHID